jgi:hypothetical protein
MKHGEIRVERLTQESDRLSNDFLNEAAEQLARDLGVRFGDLHPNDAYFLHYSGLPSKEMSGAATANQISFLIYKEKVVAVRYDKWRKWTVLGRMSVYFGLVNDEADRSDHGT